MIYMAGGGGTNMMGLLIGLRDRGIKPDLLLMADPGAEMPHTYAYLPILREWLKANGFPDLILVRDGKRTIVEDCMTRHALPAVAYGFKTCSQRFKIQPQDKWLNNYGPARKVWERGEQITKIIGYDADEPQRAKDYISTKFRNWYPLVEWGWGRQECIEAIEREGLPQPGKSACFICPNMHPTEIRAMADKYPELAKQAVEIERNADLTRIAGLGRTFSWENLLKQGELFDYESVPVREMPCGCYDGAAP